MSWVFVAIGAALIVSIAIAVSVKQPEPETPQVREPQGPTATEGREIPVVFGTVLVRSPNVVWYGDLATSPVRTKSGK